MIRTETGDGATLAGRPELGTILEFIHLGETLVVTRIDRLARSMRDLQRVGCGKGRNDTLIWIDPVKLALRFSRSPHSMCWVQGAAGMIHDGGSL